jgi:hypothetical protein
MPSPFPGMDPFIESQRWQGFHTRFIVVLGDMLVAQVRPNCVVEVEEYVYLSRDDSEPDRLIEADVALVETMPKPAVERQAGESVRQEGGVATLVPAMHTVTVSRRRRQKFLTIRNRQFQHVVTVIELLSPWNKTPGDGLSEYLVKRNNIFNARTNLVELDLLRGGQRLPTREPLAQADFYAYVCRAELLPKIEIYAWALRDRLPGIPVPLSSNEVDVRLDLQLALTTTYDRCGYDYAIDYTQAIEPSLDDASLEWVRSFLPR